MFILINNLNFAEDIRLNMDSLFSRHIDYLSDVPTAFVRKLMDDIDWDSRLLMIRGPKESANRL